MDKDGLIIVNMNDAKISTLESPIIGTYGLATCVGILLYDEEGKRAIVAHVSASDPLPALNKMFNIVLENKLWNVKFKYKIFDGYYKDASEHYKTFDVIMDHFKDYTELENIPDDAVLKNHKCDGNEFYFDAITGKFVTSEVLSSENNKTR